MAIFFLKYQSENAIDEDANGYELPDLDAARNEAVQAAREVVSEAVRFGRDIVWTSIIVCDGEGRELLVVPLADVLPPSLGNKKAASS